MKTMTTLFRIMLNLALVVCFLEAGAQGKNPKAMNIVSSSFNNQETIPSKFTCDGANISPALQWSGQPAGTKSFVMIADDPDAPSGMWVHWILFNIPASVTSLAENFSYPGRAEKQILAGSNDFHDNSYGGPCPPSGTHRYFFKIYALDAFLDLKEGSTKSQVEKAMSGHVLARGELVGLYQRR